MMIWIFNWRDTKHVLWLFGNFFKQLFKGDFAEAVDSLYWIKIHFEYEHRLIEKPSDVEGVTHD